MKKIVTTITLAALLAAGCTNLEETLYDKVETSDYGKTAAEIETIVGGAYAKLRGFRDNTSISYPTCEYVFFLTECASDEMCIPFRPPDWQDSWRYVEAEYHAITPTNAMVLAAWRYNYTGIAAVNKVIFQVDQSTQTDEEKALINAELRGLRAYYYYNLLDLFGNVPLVIDFADTTLPATSPRKDVFAFVESELLDIMDVLPENIIYGRFTRNVGYTLLARLYLNAEVFTTVVDANGVVSQGTPRWEDCISACDKVSGYVLESDYFANFLTENQFSGEIIFAIPYDHTEGTVGNYMASCTYHYNQRLAFSPTGQWPWSANGPCGQPGLWSSFDDNDVRKKSLLEGEQVDLSTGTVISTRDGLLNYTEDIHDFMNAYQYEGVRLHKYEVKSDELTERDHDWVVMRYAEVLLMKAECLIRLGNPTLARPLMAQIRTRAGLDTPENVDLEFLDDELMREFVFEGHRRTDNIRSGDYFKGNWMTFLTPLPSSITPSTERYTGVFPIPESETKKNPKLVQNPGYLTGK